MLSCGRHNCLPHVKRLCLENVDPIGDVVLVKDQGLADNDLGAAVGCFGNGKDRSLIAVPSIHFQGGANAAVERAGFFRHQRTGCHGADTGQIPQYDVRDGC